MKRKHVFLEGYKPNFETLRDAVRTGRIALLETMDARTGELVACIVAVNPTEDGGADFVPIARMLDGNPYEYMMPPDPRGGFHPVDPSA